MEKDEIIKKMVSILASEFEVEEDIITPEANIKETMHLDSLSLVDMVGLVEEEFGVEIKTADLPKIKTFADLYEYVFANQKDE
ncbi:MAG: acyl carrier protein [Bacteroidales bacterium]|nr:acyl carrier protein [Bacteroidales bacterium]